MRNILTEQMGYLLRLVWSRIAHFEEMKSRETIIDADCKTSDPCVDACGEVTKVSLKQIIVATGQGATGLSQHQSAQCRLKKLLKSISLPLNDLGSLYSSRTDSNVSSSG